MNIWTGKITFYLTVLDVEHWCVVVGLRSNFLNDLLSKFDIKFVPIFLSGKYFDDWNLVLLLTEEWFLSIIHNENGVVIPLMTEIY